MQLLTPPLSLSLSLSLSVSLSLCLSVSLLSLVSHRLLSRHVQTQTLGVMVELYGENFTTHLTVYFGNVAAETFYRCEELLMCHRPDFSLIQPDSPGGICRRAHVC